MLLCHIPIVVLCRRQTCHILDSGEVYLRLILFLEEYGKKPEDVMAGKALVFGDQNKVHKDAILESLLSPSEHDVHVSDILQVLFPAMAALGCHMYAYILPGGKYWGLKNDLAIRDITKGESLHNKFTEATFAFIDFLGHCKPNICGLAIQAYTLFTFNKTGIYMAWK